MTMALTPAELNEARRLQLAALPTSGIIGLRGVTRTPSGAVTELAGPGVEPRTWDRPAWVAPGDLATFDAATARLIVRLTALFGPPPAGIAAWQTPLRIGRPTSAEARQIADAAFDTRPEWVLTMPAGIELHPGELVQTSGTIGTNFTPAAIDALTMGELIDYVTEQTVYKVVGVLASDTSWVTALRAACVRLDVS